MNPVPLNYTAILVAGLSSIVVGTLWYGPLFGKPWMKLMGYGPEMKEKAQKDPKAKAAMQRSYALALLGSLVMAYVMAHSLAFAEAYLKTSGVMAGLQVGFWNWLGFVVPVTLGTVLWESRPWSLWKINAGHYLVAMCVQGVILAMWK